MSKLLYIEDELVDLYPNAVIAQTLQVFDPGRLGSIVTNYTSSIRLPPTFTNEKKFGHLRNSKSKSNIPYTSLSARYEENGIPIIRNGRVVLNEANEGAYSLSVYSGPWGFFEIIQDLTLWDLDFSDINGPWTRAVRDALRTATTGLVQALVDDGRLVQDQASSAPTIENTGDTLKPPQIYYHTVIEKIFESAGFEYVGDIFTNPIFLKLVMPLSVVYNDPSFTESRMFSAAAPGDQVMINPTIETSVLFNVNIKQGSEEYYDGSSEYVVENPDTTGTFFRVFLRGSLNITVAGGTVDIILRVTDLTPLGAAIETNVGSGTYDVLQGAILKDGDVAKIVIVANTGTPTVTITSGAFFTTSVSGFSGSEFTVTIAEEYTYFQKTFDLHKQIDFLKEFCVRFNVQITQINNVLHVNTLNKILDDQTGPDWTTKRDFGKDRIRYYFSTYAKTNVLKTPIDTEVTPDLTDEYGNGSFGIPNENIRENFTLYTSIFKASQMINTFGVFMLDMNLLPDSANFGRMPGTRLFFVREPYDFEPPVLYDTVDRSDYLVGYWFDPNQEYEMSWQFFIDNFHQKFIDRCLRRVRLIEREYNLNDLDIFAFNQQVPIRDNNERFLVTKIINRVSGKVCKVELLKIEPNPENFFTFGVGHQITGTLEDTMEEMGDNVPAELDIEFELIESVTGNPTWQVTFDNVEDTKVLTAIGNAGADSDILDHTGELDVDADVLKTNNDGDGPDGFPTATGWVEWLRNGVQVNTETFDSSSHSSAQGLNYTYPDVKAFEVLKVIVHEDGTSP